MNKKRLSVVMAGAMLATSVAPVLAEEVQKSEVSANELGLLQKELRELLASKVYSNIAENGNYKNKSVYAIYVNGTDTGLDVNSTQTQWQDKFNSLNEGDKVEVYSKGFKEDEATKTVYAYETVKGGEGVVSSADYKSLKSVVSGINRVAGENRYATNAEIIKKYYKREYVGMAKNVIVAADGLNGTKLVDALAVANFAAEKKAPIVLATNKLSKEQENALELNAKKSFALYQVGGKVSIDVVKTIAQNLGLTNR